MLRQALQPALRNLVTRLTKVFLRARVAGLEHYPHHEQRVLIVANHVSALDWLLLATLLPDRPVFVIAPGLAPATLAETVATVYSIYRRGPRPARVFAGAQRASGQR